MEIEHGRKIKIKESYFGSKSSKFPVTGAISPDCKYLMSGSEDGKPYCWDLLSADHLSIDSLEYEIIGPVSTIDWNNGYHMIAISGYGDNFPIVVYIYETDPDKIEE